MTLETKEGKEQDDRYLDTRLIAVNIINGGRIEASSLEFVTLIDWDDEQWVTSGGNVK